MAKTEISFLYVTTSSAREAEKLSQMLLKKKLVACTNVFVGMTSYYRWKGRLEKSKEAVLILKTKKSLVAQVTVEIKKRHSYECPCILSFPVKAGNKDYVRWLRQQLA